MNLPSPDKKYNTYNHRVFSCQYHVIFCPKYRRRVLVDGVDTRLKEILLDTIKECNATILDMEVMPDHVHLLIDSDPEYGIVDCVKHLKHKSSMILRKEFPYLKKRLPSLWTRSYFVSTVGAVSLEVVKKYIDEQKKV